MKKKTLLIIILIIAALCAAAFECPNVLMSCSKKGKKRKIQIHRIRNESGDIKIIAQKNKGF